MNDLRRALRLALVSFLSAVVPASAAVIVEAVPRISAPSLGSLAAPSAMMGASFNTLPSAFAAPLAAASLPAAPAAAAPLAVAPAALAAPALAAPALVAAPAASIIPTGPAAVAAAPALAPESAGAPALDSLRNAAASQGPRRGDSGSRYFDGGRNNRQAAPVPASTFGGARATKSASNFIKNADGVWVGGRVAEQALWINRMYAELSPKIDLADVMNVMDDAYDEARVKLRSVEKTASDRKIAASSVHLEGTRNWVDAILEDADGNHIAVHTHRVYFHPAPKNPASEISEGIRRVDKYLEKAKSDFGPGGLAEQEFKEPFAAVELNFDTRGYQQIEDHLRAREAEFKAEFGDRFKFNYWTEPKMESKPLRAEYNRLVENYMDQPEGLMGILDGVTYSREVGVGHELNSHKKRLAMGLKVVQAGRDFFGKKVMPDGSIVEEYKTEFDAVTEPVADSAKPLKDRDVVLWEDKSTRVWMTLEKTMEDTFLYKLRIYRENRAIIEASLGAPLKVAFSVDVGGLNRRAAKQGIKVWKDLRQKELLEHLEKIGPELSKEYGFPVSFIFVNSHPNEDPDLFSKPEMSAEDWEASQGRGGNGRKHGKGGKNRR
jgi:hypothetical protein